MKNTPSIYLFHSAGTAVLKGVDNPATATLVQNVFPTLDIAELNLVGTVYEENIDGYSPYSNPVIVQSRMYQPQQNLELQAGTCCASNNNAIASLGHTVNSGTATWSYGANSNPWGATGPVYMSGDLIFNAGSNITINGMEFRFGPEADVIIKTGAFVKLNSNSKWTSYECDGLMWPGVDLMGNSVTSQPSTEIANSAQGVFVINNSAIENALIGVEVGTSAINTGGGVLKGYTAIFRNCQMGVRYQPYSSYQYGQWYTSTWIVDAHLKDPALSPVGMVCLKNMAGNISFSSCSFINSTPYSVYPMLQRGYGLSSTKSRFSLSGNGGDAGSYSGTGDLAHTSFYRWQYGIIANNGGTTSFSCTQMHFQECNIGLTATAISNASIVLNNFIIPSNALIWTQKPRGVILTGCTGYSFRENDFFGASSNTPQNNAAQNVGAMIVASGGAENLSYRNDFQYLWKGQEVQQNNRVDLTGLQLRCNTYENIKYDQYLASLSQWRHNQGDASAIVMMANNKFSVEIPTCSSSFYDMYVHPNQAAIFEFDYIRPEMTWYDPDHSGPNYLLEVQPGVYETFFNSPFMEDFCPGPDFCSTQYTYAQLCPYLPQITDIGGGIIEHETKLNSLETAKNLYQMVVDGNQTSALEAAINAAFPIGSLPLRDNLISKTPLSDEVMKEASIATNPMDSWHLTQVLLANSPLTKDVFTYLEEHEVLSPFFMNFLYEADITGAANYRKLLEYEIAARESERHNSLSAIVDFIHQNPDQTDFVETLYPIMLADGSTEAKLWLLEYHIAAGNEANAHLLLNDMASWPNMLDFVQLKDIQLDVNNDWATLSASQLNSITTWAANPSSSAYAAALGVLYSLSLTDAMPEPEVPEEDRSYNVVTKKGWSETKVDLTAFPNPTNGATFISYPLEADGIGKLEVYDELGKLVLQSNLNTRGVFELDMTHKAAGVYLIRLVIEGKTIAENKLVVTE